MHQHHIVARSRGGKEDRWNLVELDPYTHAYEHALDFVLFEHAPRFDFRHEAWALLPEELKQAVLRRSSERMRGENNPLFARTGELHPSFGKVVTERTRKILSERNQGPKNPMYGKKRTDVAERTGEKHHNSKKVEVIYPDGSIELFPCTKAAGLTLGCPASNVARWAREGRVPGWGKFAGFTFRYL